jgi:hypothetical protein
MIGTVWASPRLLLSKSLNGSMYKYAAIDDETTKERKKAFLQLRDGRDFGLGSSAASRPRPRRVRFASDRYRLARANRARRSSQPHH